MVGTHGIKDTSPSNVVAKICDFGTVGKGRVVAVFCRPLAFQRFLVGTVQMAEDWVELVKKRQDPEAHMRLSIVRACWEHKKEE